MIGNSQDIICPECRECVLMDLGIRYIRDNDWTPTVSEWCVLSDSCSYGVVLLVVSDDDELSVLYGLAHVMSVCIDVVNIGRW